MVFSVGAVLLAAPVAAADSVTSLSIPYADMVVDEANDQVFVSGGPGLRRWSSSTSTETW